MAALDSDLWSSLGLKVTDLVTALLLMLVSLVANFVLVTCASSAGLGHLNCLSDLMDKQRHFQLSADGSFNFFFFQNTYCTWRVK